ncbi:hypothetical protein CAOG_06414 [Capsaspora owczarzaki ATCC 30864]|uniref:Uncharacterized protein n=1 Tax=Capsaspora owczarzaki (strain ATCC 30864) TaxID=595528 RepID=A0A0D2WTZ5_CAPO3|nr:hypothetical protein CAOG_06414 [Capsaspora owczarzaki ATCC 30864]KJE96040.1 hypothetical protein CAOG_006414 [Capsaspora owczarzaki ATCC 30864]|eukprot:XP_004345163.1 hypothetical protein CAOG_06414 [Capsaspora owczarzaki ATCC 30864]
MTAATTTTATTSTAAAAGAGAAAASDERLLQKVQKEHRDACAELDAADEMLAGTQNTLALMQLHAYEISFRTLDLLTPLEQAEIEANLNACKASIAKFETQSVS